MHQHRKALRAGRSPNIVTRRVRRGATLVFVALMSVVMVAMAAFAIDVSRLYVGVNELQTGADAAALRGAIQLQKFPGLSPADSAIAMAAKHRALGSPITLNSGNIETGDWNDATRTFTPRQANASNAVRVTASATGSLLFGRLISQVAQTPQRRAIAWLANVTGVDCIKPWGISRSLFETRHSIDLTTQAGVNTLANLANSQGGPAALTVVLSPDVNSGSGGSGNGGGGNGNGGGGNGNGGGGNGNGNSGGGGPTTVTAPTDSYQAVTGDQNASPNSHEALITGTGCGNGTSEFSTNTTFQQPGQGNQVAQRADAMVRQTQTESGPCKKGPTTNDAACYDPAQAGFVAGPIIVVPLTVPAGQPNRTTIVMLTRFRMMCAFTADPPGNPLGPSPETCPWLQSIGQPATGYRRGTIVGYPVSGFASLGPGTQLGNTVATGQRLILVQ